MVLNDSAQTDIIGIIVEAIVAIIIVMVFFFYVIPQLAQAMGFSVFLVYILGFILLVIIVLSLLRR
jgi:hypothetical protein